MSEEKRTQRLNCKKHRRYILKAGYAETGSLDFRWKKLRRGHKPNRRISPNVHAAAVSFPTARSLCMAGASLAGKRSTIRLHSNRRKASRGSAIVYTVCETTTRIKERKTITNLAYWDCRKTVLGSAQITARHTCQVLKVVVFALKQSIGIVGSPIPHLTTENKAVGIQSNSSSWGRVTPQQGLTALQSPPLAAMVSTCDTPQPGSASSVAVDFRIYDRLMGKVRRGGRESEDTPQKQDKSRKEARHALPSIRWPRRVRRLVGGGCAHLRSIQTQKQIHLF